MIDAAIHIIRKFKVFYIINVQLRFYQQAHIFTRENHLIAFYERNLRPIYRQEFSIESLDLPLQNETKLGLLQKNFIN